MYSELIVIIDAEQRRMDLATGPSGQLFRLIDRVFIRRDKHGQASLELHGQESDRLVKQQKRLAVAFAQAIFGNTCEHIRRRLVDAGLDPIFVQDVNQALQPGKSACLVFMSAESLVDSQRFIKTLAPLPGDLYRTTFRGQVEDTLSMLEK